VSDRFPARPARGLRRTRAGEYGAAAGPGYS
jgi:hypothetical protein